MVIECIENFLDAFGKKVSSKKWVFWQVPNPIVKLISIKIGIFVIFLRYISFETLHSFDFFTDVKNSVR